jgi:hypothetical protein
MKNKHIERNLWLLVAIMAVLPVFAGTVFGQLDIRKRTVTLDSINARNDTLWVNSPSDQIKIGRDSTLLEIIQANGGGGTINGSIDNNEIAIGSGINSIYSSSNMRKLGDSILYIDLNKHNRHIGMDAYNYDFSRGSSIFAYDLTDFNSATFTAKTSVAGSSESEAQMVADTVKITGHKFIKLTGRVKYTRLSGSLTDGIPTAAQINSVTGLTPATATAGYQVTIKDSDGTGLLYKIESDGTDWYYTALTKAL